MRGVFLLIFFLFVITLQAQDHQFGFMPNLNISNNLRYNWKINLNIESRQDLAYKDYLLPINFKYNYNQTRVGFMFNKRVGARSSVNFGYLLLVKRNMLEHRFNQQYSKVVSKLSYKIGHRLSVDETFSNNSALRLRLGYRYLIEKPLKGEKLDAGEPFLKSGVETVLSNQSNLYEIENRLHLYFGYKTGVKSKLEIGPNFRLKSNNNFIYWLVLGWYFGF